MATSADWLAALGSQLAAASDGTVVFSDTVSLLEELEQEPSLSRAEAIHARALTWQRHLASVARAVLSAQLSAVAAGATQSMSWVTSYVATADKLRAAVRGLEGEGVAAPASTSAAAGIGAALAAQHAALPKHVFDRALADVHRALKAGEASNKLVSHRVR